VTQQDTATQQSTDPQQSTETNAAAPPDGAHLYWDDTWRTEHGRAAWAAADPWVAAQLPVLRERGARRTLDLGCGPGRHAIFFARAGLDSHGLDASAYGIEHATRAARDAGVRLDLRQGALTALPYEDASFDYVLAFNVVYHGDAPAARRALAEVRRVLRPGGLYQCTMLSKRNAHYGKGTEVAADTYVQPGGPGDKAHPHLFCDEHDLLLLHRGFRLLAAEDRDQVGDGEQHWYCLFEASADPRTV
jgi:tellurite methyltransferase